MKIDKKDIKRILLITLTNVGDIILTTPIIAALDKAFPDARLDVMVGPLGKNIFINHPGVFKVIIYDKHVSIGEKKRLVQKLKHMKYDLVIDLKNSMFPMLIGSRYRTSPLQTVPKDVIHKRDFHLWKLKYFDIDTRDVPFSIHVSRKDEDYIDYLLRDMPNKDKLVAVSPTAKSLIKRWKKNGFAEVCDKLKKELGATVAMVGDRSDRESIDEIARDMKSDTVNLAGMTTIPQLAHLIKNSRLLISNDSAPMHIASAVGTKVLAIFGPTDPNKYGPLGKGDKVIKKELHCSPCEIAQCKFKHECMKLITVDEVYETARKMLEETRG
ncbi:MAG: glycosyltransferase family 9 protein [Candidatus Omnitrophica bacterium]|nr:glycosyltransferase family 9 protein [Candidatus Omnitrophota bacterium]